MRERKDVHMYPELDGSPGETGKGEKRRDRE